MENYQDAIDSLAQSNESIHDLSVDERRHIAYKYLKDASTDELFRIFTTQLGAEWAYVLGQFITENIDQDAHDMLIDEVFNAIADVVEYDITKAREGLDPNEDQLNRALDARERLMSIPAFLRRQAD